MSFSPVKRMPHGVLAARRPVLPQNNATDAQRAAVVQPPHVPPEPPTHIAMPFVRTADAASAQLAEGGFNFTLSPGLHGSPPSQRAAAAAAAGHRQRTHSTDSYLPLASPVGQSRQHGDKRRQRTPAEMRSTSSTAQVLRTAKQGDGGRDERPTPARTSKRRGHGKKATPKPSRTRSSNAPLKGGRPKLRVRTTDSPTAKARGANQLPPAATPQRARNPNITFVRSTLFPEHDSPTASPTQARAREHVAGVSRRDDGLLRDHVSKSSISNWVRMYDEEQTSYKSKAVQVEMRLRRARAYGSNVRCCLAVWPALA